MAKHADAIAKMATRHADVHAGVACAGTVLESTTYNVGKKAFLFVRAAELRLKLGASRAAARRAGHDVGKQGWVKIAIADGKLPRELDAWIAESYALMTEASNVRRAPARRAVAPRHRV